MRADRHSHTAYLRLVCVVGLLAAATACVWVVVGHLLGGGTTGSNATGGAVVGALLGLSIAVRGVRVADR